MSRRTVLVLMWLSSGALFLGAPFAFLVLVAEGVSGAPISDSLTLALVVLFLCDAVLALIVTGMLLERDGKFLNVRLDWAAPIAWAVVLLGTGAIASGLHAGDVGANNASLVSAYVVPLALAAAIALSASWCTRYKHVDPPVVH